MPAVWYNTFQQYCYNQGLLIVLPINFNKLQKLIYPLILLMSNLTPLNKLVIYPSPDVSVFV